MRPLMSNDILVQINNVQLGVTQGVKVILKQGVKLVEQLFESEPAAVLPGKKNYQIDIQQLELLETQTVLQQNWAQLQGFSVKFLLPQKTINFSNCQWVKLEQAIANGKPVLKNVTIVAGRRDETTI